MFSKPTKLQRKVAWRDSRFFLLLSKENLYLRNPSQLPKMGSTFILVRDYHGYYTFLRRIVAEGELTSGRPQRPSIKMQFRQRGPQRIRATKDCRFFRSSNSHRARRPVNPQ